MSYNIKESNTDGHLGKVVILFAAAGALIMTLAHCVPEPAAVPIIKPAAAEAFVPYDTPAPVVHHHKARHHTAKWYRDNPCTAHPTRMSVGC